MHLVKPVQVLMMKRVVQNANLVSIFMLIIHAKNVKSIINSMLILMTAYVKVVILLAKHVQDLANLNVPNVKELKLNYKIKLV